MADSKRLRILKTLTTYLDSTIRTGSGRPYQHDLQGRVTRGRSYFGDEQSLPHINILESPDGDQDPVEAGQGIAQKSQWILLINGWVDDNPIAPTDPAHNLMADVKMALGQLLLPGSPHDRNPNYLLGGLVTDLLVEPGIVRPPDELSARAYFYLRVVVGVAERLDDPYAD